MQISSEPLSRPLTPLLSDPRALTAFESALTIRTMGFEALVVLAGPQVHRRSLERDVASLAALPGVWIASQTGSKAILDEDHAASLGTYLGATTKVPSRRSAVDDAALLVLVGTVFSDFTTGFFTHNYDQAEAIELGIEQARIGHAVYPGVRLEDSLAALHRVAETMKFAPVAPLPDLQAEATKPLHGDDELNHASFWPEVQQWLQPGSTIAAEAGTAFYGALDLTLPGASDLLGQPIWSSIGYTLPATFGGALARPDRRSVLFIGDGSAQLTIQELGHLYRWAIGAVVFLLDNDGYTVERKIQSPEADYQDIVRWDWDLIPAALGANNVSVLQVSTVEQLRAALAAIQVRECAAFIHVVLPKYDAPRLLLALADGISATNAEAGVS